MSHMKIIEHVPSTWNANAWRPGLRYVSGGDDEHSPGTLVTRTNCGVLGDYYKNHFGIVIGYACGSLFVMWSDYT